jgi:hypothetical protein
MIIRIGPTVAILVLTIIASPQARAAGGCSNAANIASRQAGLPTGLLAAIGIVESGHADHPGGIRSAWPNTVNVDGAGHWFATAAEASAYVGTALARNARSIDVGCFQIDLQDHPDAFPDLRAAFDPTTNAAYAAAFLYRLHTRLASWSAAVAAYHSAIPARGYPYAALVQAAWQGRAAPRAAVGDPHVIHLLRSSNRLPLIVTP